MQTTQYKVRVNNFIKALQVRVILPDGTSAGVMSTRDAIKMALDQGLDLIEINPKALPPVCKIVDYGKFKYEEKKKQSESKKNHKIQELKEITFRPSTDANDLNHKLVLAKSFLAEGDKVKFTIKFRGREIVHPEEGRDRILWILEQLKDLIQPNPFINLEGKFMTTTVSPTKSTKTA